MHCLVERLSKYMYACVQFVWEVYEEDIAILESMPHAEVVAYLKRNSDGFSRCVLQASLYVSLHTHALSA